MNTINHNGSYYISKKTTDNYFYYTILGGIGLFLTLIFKDFPSIMAMPLLFGGILLLISKKPLLTLHEDYFEFKVGPMNSINLLRYKDIQNLSLEKDKVLIINDKTKTYKLAKQFFSQEDLLEIHNILETKRGV